MASISRKLFEPRNQKYVSDIKHLTLSGKGLTLLDLDLLNKCKGLESLDVSRNNLKFIAGINIPSLKILNLEHNSISDVACLSELISLETLYLDGNPLNAADRFIAIDQLPNLKTLDGKSCSEMQNCIKQFEDRLKAQGTLTLKLKYDSILKQNLTDDELQQHQKQFTRELLNKVSISAGVPPKFQRYKVQRYVDNIFKEFNISSLPNNTHQHENQLSPCMPKISNNFEKKITVSGKSLRTPPKVTTPQKGGSDVYLTPSKKRKLKLDMADESVQNYVENLIKGMEETATSSPKKESRCFTSPTSTMVQNFEKKFTISNKTVTPTKELRNSPRREKSEIVITPRKREFVSLTTNKTTPLKSDTVNHGEIKQPEEKWKNVRFSPNFTKVRQSLKMKYSVSEPGLCNNKQNVQTVPAEVTMNSKQKTENTWTYKPQSFLRCHVPTNNPQDSDTPVWRAAFEPDVKDECITTDIVATCGGNIVCFINCKTGHVLKRYKSNTPSESFYTLAWTVLETSKNKKTTILAVGGKERTIHLMHPLQLKCYHTFKAHTQPINCVKFHHDKKTWLFSGSTDMTVHLWDIGVPSLPHYKTCCQKLKTFSVNGEVLQVVTSKPYNCLFVSSSNGLMLWDLSKNDDKWTRGPNVTFKIPGYCKLEDSDLVDGLALLSDNHLAVKVSQSGKIFFWDISAIFPYGNLIKTRSYEIEPAASFVWSDCNTDYNYIDTCPDAGIIACGDNLGRLWIYKARQDTKENGNQKLELPMTVLPWPKLTFKSEELKVRQKVIINSVKFNWNAEYLVACTDTNLIGIWKRGTETG